MKKKLALALALVLLPAGCRLNSPITDGAHPALQALDAATWGH